MPDEDTRSNGKKTGKGNPPVEFQFKAGNPGRPKGSRNKLGEEFIEALHADFHEHGAAAIARVREDKPDAYMKVVASLLPREIKVTASAEELTDEQLNARIRQLAAALSLEIGREEGTGGTHGGDEAPLRPH